MHWSETAGLKPAGSVGQALRWRPSASSFGRRSSASRDAGGVDGLQILSIAVET